MGAEVVENDVKLAVRKGRGDAVHEVEKLDAAVQNLALAPEQILISRVGNERVLETIASTRNQS